MVCVVLQLRQLFREVYAAQTGIFANCAAAFCEDGEFFTRKRVLFDRFADDFFRNAVGIDIR